MLVNANPPEACSKIDAPPTNETNKTGKWIVLISRNRCSYEVKVRMAQSADFDAVIVYNVGSDTLVPMMANNSTGIHIPSVFVGETHGLLLGQLYANSDFYLIINSDIPFNINTHLLLPFAIVVGICFIVMIVFMVSKNNNWGSIAHLFIYRWLNSLKIEDDKEDTDCHHQL